jgi:RimJ/RimL family protein N-acetyltransferase
MTTGPASTRLRIPTPRLDLLALEPDELRLLLTDPAALEGRLGLQIERGVLDTNVQRALRRKLEKLERTDPETRAWYTYWLIVVRAAGSGAGLIGFKGFPDESGATEVGYGLDSAFRNRGYMTEALRALRDWAFAHPFCRTITATTVTNPASCRVLEKLGARLVESTPVHRSWELVRPDP